MAQQVVIKKGDEMLEDVTLTKPDTKVNLHSNVKYPTDDLCRRGTGGAVQTSFVEDEETFYSPNPARQPADPDAEDEGETGETETGETESGQ